MLDTLDTSPTYAAGQSLTETAANLAAASRIATTSNPLPERLQLLLALLSESVRYDSASIALASDQAGDRAPVAVHAPGVRATDAAQIHALHRQLPILPECAEHRQTALLEDVSGDERWRGLPGEHPVGSYLGVPLYAGGTTTGVLHVISHDRAAFGPDEVALAEAYGGIASAAIENVRLSQEADRKTDELRLFVRLAQVISSLELDAVLDVTYEEVSAAFHTDTFFIALYDSSQDQLDFRIAYDAGSRLERFQQTMSKSESMARWIIEKRKPFLSQDMRLERNQLPVRGVSQGAETRSWMGVPLMFRGELIGVMSVQSYEAGLYREGDLKLLQAIAHQVAVAINNAVAHEQSAEFTERLAQRLSEMSTLHDLSQQVTSSLDVERVLETVADALRQVLGARAAAIHLLNPETGELVIRAASGIKARWVREARLKVGEGIAGKVAASTQPIYVPDTHAVPDFIFFDRAVRSLLVVPLTVQGRVIGTFSVDSDLPSAFSGDDERFLTIAAAQAAVAIENAQLYADLENRYRELQELDLLKDELVQNVSHELRTPLTFLRSYIELLLDEKNMGQLNDRQRDSLEIVARKTNTLTRLVDDIVSSQQIDSTNLNLAYLDMRDVARVAIAAAGPSAEACKVSLVLEAEDDLPQIPGDSDRLSQVFDNLLGNAIKFSPPDGTVSVRLQRTDEQPGVLISVSDEGIGIPESELNRVFQRFYQVDGSPSRRFGGIGLGLAIVRRIIEVHGGRVWVDSQEGCGSTFYVQLLAHPSSPLRKRVGGG